MVKFGRGRRSNDGPAENPPGIGLSKLKPKLLKDAEANAL